jgi:beta propeller repeat protein
VVDWPWVVWQARSTTDASAPWQLEATNLETAQFFTVNATATDQLDPALHAGRVVWQDFRDVGFGEIYFRDLETGDQRRLTNNTFGQYVPHIDGDWVVWQDNRHTQVDIYGFDLRRMSETRLTNTTGNEARPRIAGNWVLFTEDSAGPLTANFVILDLGTGRSVPLTRTTSAKSSGSIAGGRLYWQQGPSGTSTLQSAALPALQPVFQNQNAVAITPALASAHGNAFSLLSAWHADAAVTSLSRFQSLSPLVIETATIAGGSPTGDNFALTAGQFVWVSFNDGRIVDLGTASSAPIDLPSGVSAFSHTGIPVGFTGHDLVRSLGLANVNGVRVLDSAAGVWRTLAVDAGTIRGDDFRLPNVAVLIVDLSNPVTAWTP